MNLPGKEHCVSFLVRDSECDQYQGVNNSHYMCYFEHARFQYLREHLGWDLVKLTGDHKIGFVVANCTIEFRRPLVANDRFQVVSTLERVGRKKFQFNQRIHRANSADAKPLATAVFMCVSVDLATGSARDFPVLDEFFAGFAEVERVLEREPTAVEPR